MFCSVPIVRFLTCLLGQDVAPHCSSFTYESLRDELFLASALPLGMRRLALFALELLPDCEALDAMPARWQFQLNCDIPDLRTRSGKRVSTQLLFMCRHWIDFLCEADCTDDEVMAALSHSIPSLRHWVAAMGIVEEIELVCRALKALYMWLVCSETPSRICDSYIQLKDSKEVVNMKQTIYDLYRWVMHSRGAFIASSLSVIGAGHPFVPSDSPLCQAFGMGVTDQCQIVAGHMNSNQAWPSQIFKIRISGLANHALFSPDGCRLAAASDDGIVHVWDAVTGASLQELKGHVGWVLGVAFSPNSRYLASASDDCTLRLWDVATGASLQELRGHKGNVNFVVFSPDGHHLASASDDHTVRVWDAATGVSLQEFRGHAGWVRCVTFSPDGRHLASASRYTVCIWDAATGLPLQTLKGYTGNVWSVAFSPDGCHLASASTD